MVLKHNSMVEIGDVYMTKTKDNSPHKGIEPRNDRRSKQISSRQLKETQSQDREQYYKFYLESAQRAIDMMRKQHRNSSSAEKADKMQEDFVYDNQPRSRIAGQGIQI